jgi:hypothetical protein
MSRQAKQQLMKRFTSGRSEICEQMTKQRRQVHLFNANRRCDFFAA